MMGILPECAFDSRSVFARQPMAASVFLMPHKMPKFLGDVSARAALASAEGK